MIAQLNFLRELTTELRNDNSVNNKKVILKKYYEQDNALFNKLMDYVYSFDKKYWLTSANVIKLNDKFADKTYDFDDQNDLFDVLNQLTNRIITGYNSIRYIIDLIKFCGEDYRDIIFCIIDKDLNAGVSVANINKISNCVKEFKVALAERYDEAPEIHKIDFVDGTWMVSRKLDGVRTIALKNGDDVEFYSRTGSQFQTLNSLKEQVLQIMVEAQRIYGEEYILDGECCLVDANGKDDFSGIMKQITRKDYTIDNPSYILFDMVKKSEFLKTIGTVPFSERIKELESLNVEKFGKYVKIVQHECNIDLDGFKKWQDLVTKNNWEGLVLRDQKSVYSGKRSYDLQKVKSFFDAEYKVVGIETGVKKMLRDDVMHEINCVKSLEIIHKGAKMNVGSGLSDTQRVEWYDNPELIIGKTITVQYFEETVDSRTNTPSLRFPTLKCVYGEKREV
ncbi:MAG: hypothetical protein LBM76_02520 [Mycoplasmataceae bacterium]|nr:hypothetical protein [Mycoplasmataceae bacterium]